MKAGIIAAGEGARLHDQGVVLPKPLVPVGGISLLERTLRNLISARIDGVALIVNERMAQLAQFVHDLDLPIPCQVVIKSTASSLHSLYHLRDALQHDRFVLCTVDSVILPSEFIGFVRRFATNEEVDVLLSYTDFIDDEKPLYLELDSDGRVSKIGQSAQNSPFVTVGLYGMIPRVFDIAGQAIARGDERLRNLLALLLQERFRCQGYRLSKAIDVDRPSDIEVAEKFLIEAKVNA